MRNPLAAFLNPVAEAPVPVGAPRNTTGGANPLMSFRTSRAAAMERLDDAGIVFAIINTRAKRLAAVKWDLVRLDRGGSANQTLDDAEIFDRPHMAATTWAQPNDHFSRTTFLQAWSTYYDMVGEAYIAPTFVGSIPIELWLLEPQRMTPQPDPNEYLLGWDYRDPTGLIHSIPAAEVWQQRFPNPNDRYRGLGAIQAAAVDVAISQKTAAWNLTFFKNSAEPGAVIEVDSPLTDPEYKRLQAEIKGNHQGVRNAHKTMILQNAKYVVRSFSPKDMELSVNRQLTDEQIRQAFAISKTNLGLSEDVNRATADTARDTEAVDHTIPKLEELQMMLNTQFLPGFGAAGRGLAFRYQNPRPANVEDETKQQDSNTRTWQAMVAAGADPVEAAEALSLPQLAFKPKPVQAIPIPPAAPVEDDEPDPSASLIAHIRAITDNEDPEPDGPTPELLVYQNDFERALALLIAEFDGITNEMIAALIVAVVAALASDDPATALTDIRLPQGNAVATIVTAATALAETSTSRSQDELRAIDIEDPPAPPPDTETITAEAVISAALIAAALTSSGVNEAVRVNTADITPAAVGESVDEFLRGLTGASRDQQLATRMSSTQQQARLDAFEAAENDDTEVATKVVWLADETLDANTCGPCRDVEGRLFETIAEARKAYPSGGFRSCDGRDRCRGTVVPVRVDTPIGGA